MRARTVVAAVISAALILGGAVMLVGDDAKQEMKIPCRSRCRSSLTGSWTS